LRWGAIRSVAVKRMKESIVVPKRLMQHDDWSRTCFG
jgi:hypothetical protein